MKKSIYRLTIVLMIMTAFLSSCLKDDKYALDPSLGSNVIEFYNVTAPITGYNDTIVAYQPKLFQVVPEDEFQIGVNYAGPENLAPRDIVVNLAIDPVSATRAGYVQLDPALYEGLPASVTIKRGEKRAFFTIKVKPEQFDLNKKNAIGVAISSVSYGVISGNVGVAVFSLPVKNDYDGIYAVEDGYLQRYSSPGSPLNDALTGSLKGNPNMTLTTVDKLSNTIVNFRWAGGASSVAGIDNLRLRVDPVTNEVTLFALGNATLANWGNRVNKYDPETRTFTLNFAWNPAGATREATLVLRWLRDR